MSEQETLTYDHLVKCNSCGFVRRNLDSTPCPKGHEVGWSYLGPLPEEGETDGGDETGEFPSLPEEPEDQPEFGEVEEDEAEPDEDRDRQIEEAVAEVCQAQKEFQDAVLAEQEKVRQKNEASQKIKAKQGWLNDASMRLRFLREGRFPDPQKFPLFDKAKDTINASFPKPEAIEPLPAEDFAEFRRRKMRDTDMYFLDIDSPTIKALERAGIITVAEFVRKSDALAEANASLTTIKGLDEAKVDAITEALVQLQSRWLEEWAGTNPEGPGE